MPSACPFHTCLALGGMALSLLFPRLASKLAPPPRAPPNPLQGGLRGCSPSYPPPPSLLAALSGVLAGVAATSLALRRSTAGGAKAGSSNASGDAQLELDLLCDARSFAALRACGRFRWAVSEETPARRELAAGGEYACSFDPLDGSSVIGPNFAVGGIYAVWAVGDSGTFVGRSGREVLASVVAVYGSRTTAFVGVRGATAATEYTLVDGEWKLTAPIVSLPHTPSHRTFAFGNLRATADSRAYRRLLDFYLAERYTLRYTGGMVPDVMHILSKSGGVFTNVSSPKARAKLRFLYEIAAVALLVEVAGGAAVDEGGGAMLDVVCDGDDMRVGGCIGSKSEVEVFKRECCGIK
ncbi:hypothetical protein TeGR_g5400 [Tetraparma gracilis]|uniref:Fructose-bisphosphatase n=1 Tax=Tetraparma gracilis TaxID=2962635 RepID=A0ABQ6MHF7_9STRA|nr:hypothetical protein TeGR_g5400 [Tetraparma gracilis]